MTVRYTINNVLSSLNLVEGYEVIGTLYDDENIEIMKLSMKGNNKYLMLQTLKLQLEPYKAFV